METGTDDPTQQHTTIKVYPNLARIAIVLGMVDGWIVWELRRVAHSTTGHNKTTVSALFDAIQRYNVGYSLRQLRAILNQYDGLLWHYNGHKSEYVSFGGYGQENITATLNKLVLERLPNYAKINTSNSIGSLPRQDLDFAQSDDGQRYTTTIKARIYSLCINAHNGVKISRERQSQLFNVTPQSLRNWEQIANIEVNHDYHEVSHEDVINAEHPDKIFPHKHYYPTKDGYRYQSVNSYHATVDTSATTQGQRARVRSAVNTAINKHPDSIKHVGDKKRYFDSAKALQRHIKKHGEHGNECVFAGWYHVTTKQGKRVRINRYKRSVILNTQNLTPIKHSSSNGVSDNVNHVSVTGNGIDSSKQDTTQPEPVTHHTHERTHATRQPVTVPPATTDNRQSATRYRQPVTVNPPELVHDHNRQSAIDAYEKAQPAIGKIGVYATLRPSRVRITPTGAILWQPDYIPDTLPEHAEVVTCTRGERWLAILEPSHDHKQSYFASCPDLSDKLLTMALTRRRQHSDRVKSWQNKKSVLGVSA